MVDALGNITLAERGYMVNTSFNQIEILKSILQSSLDKFANVLPLMHNLPLYLEIILYAMQKRKRNFPNTSN